MKDSWLLTSGPMCSTEVVTPRRHTQDTHVAQERPMAAALDLGCLGCPEPSMLEAQQASCFVFSSQSGAQAPRVHF